MSALDLIYMLVQLTMGFAIPLLVVALGGMFCERSGIVNVALDGIMIIGALAGTMFIHIMQRNDALSGNLLYFLALIVAAVFGILFSLLHAYASINMKANQVISGTALNLAAPSLAIFIGRLFTEKGVQQIDFVNQFRIEKVPVLGSIPIIGNMFFQNVYITTYIGFGILLLSAFVLFKTRFGLRLRSCGEHPQASDSVGINVYKMRYAGVIISGVLGGIGGLIFVIPNSTNFNATVSGYGFLALAVMIFGQWNPWKILYASLFFGFLRTVAATYSVIPLLNNLGLPMEIYKMVPYIATIIVLIFSSKNSQAPRAEGIPYDKGSR